MIFRHYYFRIQRWLYNYRVRQAKKEADELASITGKKYFVVLNPSYRPVVISKQELRRIYKRPKAGWESLAIYIAFPNRL